MTDDVERSREELQEALHLLTLVAREQRLRAQRAEAEVKHLKEALEVALKSALQDQVEDP